MICDLYYGFLVKYVNPRKFEAVQMDTGWLRYFTCN